MANQAVVGILRTLLTADTAQYETGMKKAAQTATQTGKVIGSIGEQIRKTNPQLERMVKAFQGDKLLYQANNLVAAVQKVGGAARLTEAEQRRVNTQVTLAIDKYRALGQQAPKAMVDLAQATRQTEVATSKFGSSLMQVRGFAAAFGVTLGTGAVVAFGRQLLDTADTLVKVADRTGLTTTEVQKLEFIARQSGNTIDDFTSAIGQLQNRLIGGDKGAIQALKFLNINLQALKDATPFNQLSMIAKALADIEDPAARARVQVLLFGRAGLAILPTMIADFEKLGNAAPAMSDKTVRALDEAGDALNLFQMQLKVWAAEAFLGAGRLLDIYTNAWRRGLATLLDLFATLLSFSAKIPGVGNVFAAFGVTVESVRAKAQEFRDQASALEQMWDRQEPDIRKNTNALVDYDALLNKTTESTKKLTFAQQQQLEQWRNLSTIANQIGMAQFAAGAAAEQAAEDAFSSAVEFQRLSLQTELEAKDRAAQLFLEAELEDHQRREGEAKRFQETLRDINNKAGEEQMQGLRRLMEEAAEARRRLLEMFTMPISDALAGMLVGLRSFKDGFLDIWRSIQQGFANILAEMLDQFVGSFLKGMVNALGGARLGQAFGGVLTGAAGGVGAGALAAGSASFAAAEVAGVEAAALGAAGSGGAGAAVAGLATNPFTIAAAGGIAIGLLVAKKGLFRGGEEAMHVNPRRDQFLSQFGDPGEKGVGGGAHNLAAILTRLTGMPAGGPLFRGLQMADSVKEFVAAQTAVIQQLAKGGVRGIKAFQFGGFIPPGVTQFAMLHGGEFGEMVTPLRSHPNAATMGHTVNSYNFTIHAMDGADVKRVLEREVWPRFNRETVLNQHGVASSIKRVGR